VWLAGDGIVWWLWGGARSESEAPCGTRRRGLAGEVEYGMVGETFGYMKRGDRKERRETAEIDGLSAFFSGDTLQRTARYFVRAELVA